MASAEPSYNEQAQKLRGGGLRAEGRAPDKGLASDLGSATAETLAETTLYQIQQYQVSKNTHASCRTFRGRSKHAAQAKVIHTNAKKTSLRMSTNHHVGTG